MANLTKSLVMPNGQEYEFVGKHWYGYSSTAANTQTKIVSITGFTSADLVAGTQVTIQFSYAHNYNGTPYLNVSSTGAKPIRSRNGSLAGQYEWNPGEFITFAFYSNEWFIIGGGHATSTYWGKTKLSNDIDSDTSKALTPAAVYYAHYISQDNLTAATWNGSSVNSDVIFDITTPTVDQWETTSDGKQYNVNWTEAIEEAYNTAYDDAQDKATVVKITYGDNIYLLPQYGHMKVGARVIDGDILIDYYDYYAYVIDSAAHAGAYQFKLEVLYDNLYVTYPLMEQYLSSEHYAKTTDIPTNVSAFTNDSGYLTLATLPIWNGGVI